MKQKNEKIGTFNGVDFYTSLDAMLEDGKELCEINEGNGLLNVMSRPRNYAYNFTDQTGIVENLKDEKSRIHNKILEEISKADSGVIKKIKYAIIAAPEKEIASIVTAGYPNGNVLQRELSEIKDGYNFAMGVGSIPYTVQPIK